VLKTEEKEGKDSIKIFTRGMCFGHGGADYRISSTVIFVVDFVEFWGFIEILLFLMKKSSVFGVTVLYKDSFCPIECAAVYVGILFFFGGTFRSVIHHPEHEAL
jgi:hypothetical protein